MCNKTQRSPVTTYKQSQKYTLNASLNSTLCQNSFTTIAMLNLHIINFKKNKMNYSKQF